ncbi:PAT family beta-lactamase induction signal transducer AmpG [Rhodoligotrophos appendicifer]|uniref:AmpG family muropeptide MFS transporter n=1 Tax=Rhodoligotrophos appendicifer TaxID=987056 RepID=UPI0011801A7F|nr:MFS transporter [Rhodoligotrophos appendicifer]
MSVGQLAGEGWRDRWRRTLSVYLEPRVLTIMFLGFSSGLPLALSGSTLAIWMTDRGVDLAAIGLFSLVGLPYTIKFLWAPIVDAWNVPVLSRLLGRRRGWLILSQIVLMAAILFLGAQDPVAAPVLVALGAVILAAASATQDTVIDAFRVESLDEDQQAPGMAVFVPAYRVGMLVATAFVLILVEWLERSGISSDIVWFYGYAAMAALVCVGIGASLMATEPPASKEAAAAEAAASEAEQGHPILKLWSAAYGAFTDFLSKPYVVAILLFVLLFKFCDAFAGVMTGPFVIRIGFDKADYATIVKGVGLFAVLAGGFAGGFLARALPMVTCLWIAGFLQMGSNLVFSWLAWVGNDLTALAVAISVENFTGGIGTVIFVAYLSSLCTSPLHTATQYALLSALSAVGRTVLASVSGFIAEATGWVLFFMLTAVAALPALALLAWLQSKGHFEGLGRKPEAEDR